VTIDGRGVVSHAGTRLLADVADATGVSAALSDALAGLRERRSGHDPGRVLTDVAVMLADGGEAISDLGVLRDPPQLFGPVASTAALDRVRAARAVARERAWLLRAEAGRDIPASRAGGRDWPGLVLDVDATLIDCHSDKQLAAPNFKGGFGFHPRGSISNGSRNVCVHYRRRRRGSCARCLPTTPRLWSGTCRTWWP
jgi:Transposase DDE domain group 1